MERRIHEAYRNQRFIGRDFEEAKGEETPYSTKAAAAAAFLTRTTPMPMRLLETSKRAFVVKKRKKAEALAARSRQLKGHKESRVSQNWLK